MDDRAICLHWDKKFGLKTLGQMVIYGELTREHRYILVCQYPPGTDTEVGKYAYQME